MNNIRLYLEKKSQTEFQEFFEIFNSLDFWIVEKLAYTVEVIGRFYSNRHQTILMISLSVKFWLGELEKSEVGWMTRIQIH